MLQMSTRITIFKLQIKCLDFFHIINSLDSQEHHHHKKQGIIEEKKSSFLWNMIFIKRQIPKDYKNRYEKSFLHFLLNFSFNVEIAFEKKVREKEGKNDLQLLPNRKWRCPNPPQLLIKFSSLFIFSPIFIISKALL